MGRYQTSIRTIRAQTDPASVFDGQGTGVEHRVKASWKKRVRRWRRAAGQNQRDLNNDLGQGARAIEVVIMAACERQGKSRQSQDGSAVNQSAGAGLCVQNWLKGARPSTTIWVDQRAVRVG